MRKFLVISAAFGALMVCGPLLAQQATDQGTARLQQVSATPAPEQTTCMYYFHEGAVIRRPLCRTTHSWTSERERTRQSIREFQLRSLTMQ